jgi:type VI protein secretion system component VasK
MYRDTTNVEHEVYDYTGNKRSHRNSNKSLKKNLEAVPGGYSVRSLQKTAILEITHTIQKVLQSETWSLSGGDRRCFKSSTREKMRDKRQ